MGDDAPEEVTELRRAAVMFPKLFLWIIGGLMSALTLLGGVVVAQVRSESAEQKQKTEVHGTQMADHEARLRLLEQTTRDLKETSRDTNQAVKDTNQDVKRLLELQLRREGNAVKRAVP